MVNQNIQQLLHKYDVPIPRYTSYPTVPFWEFENLRVEDWKQSVWNTFVRENGELSIYVHLPFCEQLCTFCACNKRITKNHKVEEPYIETVLREWDLYRSMLPFTPVIREIHLGGGTPTFFSPENLKQLIEGLTKDCRIPPRHAFSVEVHPNYTRREHLVVLADLGFNRMSIGVQDFDPEVQQIINRVQSFERTREVVEQGRELGYTSINIDLIYGLPRQSMRSVEYTVNKISELMPERIAFYSYAHVPWKSKVQKRYTDDDLPTGAEKWDMYQLGSGMLRNLGYESIGMDHFALAGDKLLEAYENGKMHRNFMGYTTTDNKLLIGLGASAIGDSWQAMAQNEKVVEAYRERVIAGEFPLVNGHNLSEEDKRLRRNILDLMCRGFTELNPEGLDAGFLESAYDKLRRMEDNGLVILEDNFIRIREEGRLFVRNISAALDIRLWRKEPDREVFSKAI